MLQAPTIFVRTIVVFADETMAELPTFGCDLRTGRLRDSFCRPKGNFSAVLHHPAGPLARDMRAEDRKFLDDLVQKQNQDDVLDGNRLSASVQNIGNPGMIGSANEPVPKAALVV